MGSCNGCQQSEFTESHFNSEELSMSQVNKRKNAIKKKVSTEQNSKFLDDDESIIASENSLDSSPNIPQFIQQKYIKEGMVQQRGNRFMADLEEEVRYRIKQIQQEEALEKLQSSLNDSSIHQFQEQKQDTADFNNSAHFNQSISFQNSQDFQHTQQLPSKTYLPRQYSQFAPKKDSDTVTYNSQVSQTANSYKMMRSTSPVNKITQNIKEEIKTNLGSLGSQTNNNHDSSVQFSDHFREQQSSSASKERSVRSILKTSVHQNALNRNKSIKSTYTTAKQKKVSFSNDTNYYSSRTTKRNQTNLIKK